MTRDEMKQLRECLRLVRVARDEIARNPTTAVTYLNRALTSLPLCLREEYVAEVVSDIERQASELVEKRPRLDDVLATSNWLRSARDIAIRVGGVPRTMITETLRETMGQIAGLVREAKVEVARRTGSSL